MRMLDRYRPTLRRALAPLLLLCAACSGARPSSPAPAGAEVRGAASASVGDGAASARRDGGPVFVGVVAAEETARLSFPQAARVAAVHVQVGTLVSKGTPIVDLDTAALDADLAAAAAALREARASERQARATHVQARASARALDRLFGQGVVSQADALAADADETRARSALEAARAQVQQREAALAKLRELREDTTLRSPMAGRVLALGFAPGALVPATTPIATVISAGRVVRFAVPPASASGLRVGDAVEVAVSVDAARLPARVRTLAPRVDTAMQRVVAEATFEGAVAPPEVGTKVAVHAAAADR